MLAARPPGIEVTQLKPGGVDEEITNFDRVVLTGLYGYSSRELNLVARTRPIFKVHDEQFSKHWIYDEAFIIIANNHMHKAHMMTEMPKLQSHQIIVNPGTMSDLDSLHPSELMAGYYRDDVVLWAHRPAPSKGLDVALEWCIENGRELEVMVGRPHEAVVRRMGEVTDFALFSLIFDSGPRAIMEAQLMGCNILVNDFVGYFPDVNEVREQLSTGAERFWRLVCES
jgi:hypothetical protein